MEKELHSKYGYFDSNRIREADSPRNVPPGTIASSSPANPTAPLAIDNILETGWNIINPMETLHLNFTSENQINGLQLVVTTVFNLPTSITVTIYGIKQDGTSLMISSPIIRQILPGPPTPLIPVQVAPGNYKAIQISCAVGAPILLNDILIQ